MTVPTERLHAVEGPAEDAAQVQPFQPLLLEEGLLLERVPDWMEQYESGGSTTAPPRCGAPSRLLCGSMCSRASALWRA